MKKQILVLTVLISGITQIHTDDPMAPRNAPAVGAAAPKVMPGQNSDGVQKISKNTSINNDPQALSSVQAYVNSKAAETDLETLLTKSKFSQWKHSPIVNFKKYMANDSNKAALTTMITNYFTSGNNELPTAFNIASYILSKNPRTKPVPQSTFLLK